MGPRSEAWYNAGEQQRADEREGMVPTILTVEVHPTPTSRGGLLYQFTPKHHDGRDPDAARWLPELTREEEFGVFDAADAIEIADAAGNLYGVLRGDGKLRPLGTCEERLAEFPVARPGEPWHGYPVYPVNEDGPENRRGLTCRPAKEVFARLVETGLLSKRERRRLSGGRFV
ncbi:MAG: hypothetical protein K2X82_03080 [Gemmataceae bacterium]|nr:hypothetical protein [Gemmataceae bacterium]